ncbi:cobalt chelatase [Amycolatopsis alkalitolerans]|uniref:Cobalt chelatase n=2 Tax=Amycolatopsis alkalitolerans TaxID=2547244 RepID=A0A5C4M553_9PSEU|nr:cobalt chelatase [Amycolatopsis alkalitolerans]
MEALAAAAVRALSGEPALHFRGGRLHKGHRAVPAHAPHLSFPADEDRGSFRGVADGLALRVTGSDPRLHRRLRPENGIARLVFEMLEQFRVESLVSPVMPGTGRNVRHRHRRWALDAHHSGLTETDAGLLIYTVGQVCRARITGEPVLAETEDLIEPTRAAVGAALGPQLRGLRQTRTDQAAFGRHARALAEKVAAMLAEAGSGSGDRGESETAAQFAFLLDFEEGADGGIARAESGRGPGAGVGYRIFTTAYDREVAASSLMRPALAQEYRARLDRLVLDRGAHHVRLARDLRALLAVPATDGWEGDLEEGYVDARALPRLVSSPAERAVFKRPRSVPAGDTLLTFLIDCSGSMKQHRDAVAVLVDVFARALELAGFACEILGFTTAAWNGGQARRDWFRAGRPANPGRLNEVRHLVYKDAAATWRQSRRGIAALLRTDGYREGIDGEAVAWAANRARARDERRKLLLVVSDGSPMDTATALANGEDYLAADLAAVVDEIGERGDIEVFGLGAGLDLSPFYRRFHALGELDAAGYRVFREILELIAKRRRPL